MARYDVLLRQSVLKKDLDRIPKGDLRRLLDVIRALADDPRPAGTRKLSGQEQYRIRQGDYRIVYSIQDAERAVIVVTVGRRREVYR
jgi:mRNA interferase RelE/StbE